MKRLFFLLTMCVCVSIGAWGQTVTITVSSSNSLASQISSITACDFLIIKGELTADDVAALASISANVKHVLMNEATLTDDAKKADFTFNNSNVETVVLPKDLDKVDSNWFTACSNLKSSISYSSDGKTLNAYLKQAGTLKDSFKSLTKTDNPNASTPTDLGNWNPWNNYMENPTLENVTITGSFNSNDIGNQWNCQINSTKIKNVDLGNATGDVGTIFSNNGSILESIVLPQSATTLSTNAFQNCTHLTSVTLPERLTTIPSNCFQGCSSLKEIDIPSTVVNVGSMAFDNCSGLTTLIIGKGVQSIGESAFNSCTSLETIEFEKGVTNLNFASGVFAGNESLKHVVFPEGLLNIGDNMFNQCHNLMSVRLPNSLQHIGAGAFEECSSLTYLTIPEDVKTIGDGAFANSGIKDIYLMAQDVAHLPFIHENAFGETPFTGNNSLAIDIDVFADRLKLLIERGEIEGYTDPSVVDTWKTTGNYPTMGDAYDQKVMALLPTEEVESIYRDLFINKPTIAYLHYPKVDDEGNATELSNFIDGNPWKGQAGLLNGLGGFYSQGQAHDTSGARTWYRPIDVESPRLENANHLTEAYGIGPDADGRYWPDTNHADGTYRANYGDPDNDINANDPWKETSTITGTYNPLSNGAYEGYSRYYWRNFLLQNGYSPNNDEVYSKLYDDTWYTMCFPFDLTDEQLEAAYQSNKYNICEFSSASIYPETKTDDNGEDVEVKNLVLCFTKIARTWYKDKYGNYYERTRDNDGTKHYYEATRKWVEKSDGTSDWDLTDISTTEYTRTTDNADIYDSIDGILALAGHPYMIHPYQVEKQDGTATLCVLPKITYKYNFNKRTSETLAEITRQINQLYEDEAVTRPICEVPDKDITIYEKEWDAITKGDGKNEEYGRYNQMTKTDNGTYTFKGTFLPATDDVVVAGEPTEKVIPYGAYFLGVDPNGATANDRKYPKFWRETSTNTTRTSGLWKQYSAIIIPDAAASAWETENLVPDGTVTGAKGVHMMFGDFEEVTTTDINEIVADAVKKGQKVEKVNVIVNINGQVVRQGTDVKGLPRGLYIVNGKKYMVK